MIVFRFIRIQFYFIVYLIIFRIYNNWYYFIVYLVVFEIFNMWYYCIVYLVVFKIFKFKFCFVVYLIVIKIFSFGIILNWFYFEFCFWLFFKSFYRYFICSINNINFGRVYFKIFVGFISIENIMIFNNMVFYIVI